MTGGQLGPAIHRTKRDQIDLGHLANRDDSAAVVVRTVYGAGCSTWFQNGLQNGLQNVGSCDDTDFHPAPGSFPEGKPVMDRTERFYKIDQLINERRGVPFKDLQDALEVSRAKRAKNVSRAAVDLELGPGTASSPERMSRPPDCDSRPNGLAGWPTSSGIRIKKAPSNQTKAMFRSSLMRMIVS